MLCCADTKTLCDQREELDGAMSVKYRVCARRDGEILGGSAERLSQEKPKLTQFTQLQQRTNLSVEYVNTATCLKLHCCHWLKSDHETDAMKGGWNHLVDSQDSPQTQETLPMLYWTLGCPWFREQRTMGGSLAAEWFSARDETTMLWH